MSLPIINPYIHHKFHLMTEQSTIDIGHIGIVPERDLIRISPSMALGLLKISETYSPSTSQSAILDLNIQSHLLHCDVSSSRSSATGLKNAGESSNMQWVNLINFEVQVMH